MPMFRSTGFTWKDRPIWGNAVAMIVPSRFSMKNAPATRMAIEVDLAEGSGRSLIFQDVFRSQTRKLSCGRIPVAIIWQVESNIEFFQPRWSFKHLGKLFLMVCSAGYSIREKFGSN